MFIYIYISKRKKLIIINIIYYFFITVENIIIVPIPLKGVTDDNSNMSPSSIELDSSSDSIINKYDKTAKGFSKKENTGLMTAPYIAKPAQVHNITMTCS
jgi:hypothetical protein